MPTPVLDTKPRMSQPTFARLLDLPCAFPLESADRLTRALWSHCPSILRALFKCFRCRWRDKKDSEVTYGGSNLRWCEFLKCLRLSKSELQRRRLPPPSPDSSAGKSLWTWWTWWMHLLFPWKKSISSSAVFCLILLFNPDVFCFLGTCQASCSFVSQAGRYGGRSLSHFLLFQLAHTQTREACGP